MNRFTKITASIGPKCEDRETLTRMIQAGVNMCRLNFSHDTGDVQGKKIDLIRDVSEQLHTPVAIVIDLQGPKHRIGNFATEDKYPLTVGQKFTFDTDPTPGDGTRVQLPDADVMKSLNIGDRILLNDGKIEMTVDSVSPDKIVATVVRLHINMFHKPYIKWFHDQGWQVDVAANNDYENKEDCIIPYCDDMKSSADDMLAVVSSMNSPCFME